MIDIVKPEFIVGSEKRFFDFISKINGQDKIALISHTDLDGVVAAKMANKILNVDIVKLLDYEQINKDLVEELKKLGVKKTIFTDLGLKSDAIKEISKFSDILIIDHHKIIEDFNSDKIVFLNSQGFSAGYLCYYLFSKIQNLEEYDWLAVCCSISDFMYFNNQSWMNEVFLKYSDKFEIINGQIRKSEKFWDLQAKLSLALSYFKGNAKRVYDSIGIEFGNIGDLEKYALIIEKEIEKIISLFEKEKEEFKSGWFWEVHSDSLIKDILVNIISSKFPEKIFIFAQLSDGKYQISARRQDKKVDLPNLLGKLIFGFKDATSGGHVAAAGARLMEKDLPEFKERLKKL